MRCGRRIRHGCWGRTSPSPIKVVTNTLERSLVAVSTLLKLPSTCCDRALQYRYAETTVRCRLYLLPQSAPKRMQELSETADYHPLRPFQGGTAQDETIKPSYWVAIIASGDCAEPSASIELHGPATYYAAVRVWTCLVEVFSLFTVSDEKRKQ